jgi:hypothetical protein
MRFFYQLDFDPDSVHIKLITGYTDIYVVKFYLPDLKVPVWGPGPL